MLSGKGTLFILAAPSGGGKTSLVQRLLMLLPNLEVSTSHTTRAKRPGEVDGQDYYFVDAEIFGQMVAEDRFVEHAKVFTHEYGTSKQEIANRINAGVDVLLDIDWQGARQIKQSFQSAVSIFILPPSLATLQQRLEDRKQDASDTIQRRMTSAQDELSHYNEFDYLIVNDDFEEAAQSLKSIILSQRCTLERQMAAHQGLLDTLLQHQNP